MLNMCSNLHTLVLHDYDDDIDISDSPTVIPTLTSLNAMGGTDFSRVFQSLTAPLEIDHYGNNDPTRAQIERFLDRSGCSLTSLSINASWTDQTIVALLRRLPPLQELTISDHTETTNLSNSSPPIAKVLVESLHSYQQSRLPIVPKLRSLSLEVLSTGFDHKSFVEMISSRWIPDKDYAASIGVSYIQSVELRLPGRVDEAEYLPLIRLSKMGLYFSLQC
ncbi:hypothetical protein GYMLUDRAFT_35474 [Collybiopsis luxurians FD-317 M1]|nr:hypothetical protein GYMLUDRAFT_35474 [Collybiopsis luxurians FD-317 M1]